MRTEFLRKSLFCTAFLAGAFLCGCTEESVYTDVDGQNPTFELTTDHIRTLTGYEFTMSGKISDKDGISSIRLYCPELFLDKTIDLVKLYSETQYEYNLNYSFTIPEDNKGESFKVKVTVTDLGGRTTEGEILITMDGDYTVPEINTSIDDVKIIALGEYTTKRIEFTATDDKGLDYLTVNVPEIGVNDTAFCDKNAETPFLEYTFSKDVKFPSENLGSFKMYTKAVDLLGNEAVDSCNVILSLIEDYNKMYLADVVTDAELNNDVFGIPMMIDHTGVNQYRARYYCCKANTEIYFIPQRNSFNPVRIGVNDDASKLSLSADAKPMVLADANMYYEINLDLMNSTYTMRSYSVEEADDPWATYMKYGENTLNRWNEPDPLKIDWFKFEFGWSRTDPTTVEPFTQDETNPHLFYGEKTFTQNEYFNFMIHNYHTDQWWDFISWYRYKYNDPEDGVYARYSEAKYGTRYINPDFSGPVVDANNKEWTGFDVKAGTYRIYFDSHLGRAKLVKVND